MQNRDEKIVPYIFDGSDHNSYDQHLESLSGRDDGDDPSSGDAGSGTSGCGGIKNGKKDERAKFILMFWFYMIYVILSAEKTC